MSNLILILELRNMYQNKRVTENLDKEWSLVLLCKNIRILIKLSVGGINNKILQSKDESEEVFTLKTFYFFSE